MLDFCFSLNGIAKATCADQTDKGVEHELRYIEFKELLGYPANDNYKYEKGDDQFP
jgi:hypothetical protein